MELYRDDKATGRTATLNDGNGWKYTFSGLTKYRTGNTPYTYTVKEADVPEGYTSAVDSAAGSTGNTVTATITNTLTPTEKPKEPGDPGDPRTPSEPPTTSPTDPGEPPTTPPGDPSVPPTTPPPTTPPVTPPTNPNLPQTGTVRDSAPAILCLTLATALAGCAIFFRNKRKSCE